MRYILGKPLLAHTIQAALDAKQIDRIYVSSDDPDILKFARNMGVSVVCRTAEAATDDATANEVVIDFLRMLPELLVLSNPYLVYLQPSSPMRTGKHIDEALNAMSSAGSDMCLSVTELKKSPFKSFTLTAEGRLQSLFEESLTNANRQRLPPVFYPNGAIYVFPFDKFLERRAFPSNGAMPFVMSERESIDIDTEEDFTMVEELCRVN